MDIEKSPKTAFEDALRRVAASLMLGMRHRADLALLELQELLHHRLGVLLGALVVVLSLAGVLLFASAALLLAVPEDRRSWAALGLCGFYLLLAVVAAAWLRHRQRTAPAPFALTLEELRQDCRALEGDES